MKRAAMVREGILSLKDFLKIGSALAGASKRLKNVSESPRLDAEMLLARALDVPRSYLFAHAEEEMDDNARLRFQTSIERRIDGLPMAYITGEKEFWSMDLLVSPATLVPRPETELLVDLALRQMPRESTQRVLDLGTGSGTVALALARERPLSKIVATDISEDAVLVARENARRLNLANIEFVIGDWVTPVAARRFDIVVSNPPYVSDDDPHLPQLRFEPQLALLAGHDGLDAIRRISATTAIIVESGGPIMIEHGATQAEQVADVLSNDGWRSISNTKDLAGLPRVTTAYAPE
jgi:release factor glutamine methyltransferase